MVVLGKCPRCGKEIEVEYDMFVLDDTVMADVTSIDGEEPVDVECPYCTTEIFIEIKAEAFVTAVSRYDKNLFVDWEEEQTLKEANRVG